MCLKTLIVPKDDEKMMTTDLALKHLEIQKHEAAKWYRIWRDRATDSLRAKNYKKRLLAKEKIRFWLGRLIQSTAEINTIKLLEAANAYGKEQIKSPNFKYGSKNISAKLDEDKVRLIRVGNKSDAEFAKDYGVSLKAVYFARIGMSWKHVK